MPVVTYGAERWMLTKRLVQKITNNTTEYGDIYDRHKEKKSRRDRKNSLDKKPEESF